MLLARMYLEIRQIGRTNETLPETHRPETVHVPALPESVQPIGSPIAAHEETLAEARYI